MKRQLALAMIFGVFALQSTHANPNPEKISFPRPEKRSLISVHYLHVDTHLVRHAQMEISRKIALQNMEEWVNGNHNPDQADIMISYMRLEGLIDESTNVDNLAEAFEGEQGHRIFEHVEAQQWKLRSEPESELSALERAVRPVMPVFEKFEEKASSVGDIFSELLVEAGLSLRDLTDMSLSPEERAEIGRRIKELMSRALQLAGSGKLKGSSYRVGNHPMLDHMSHDLKLEWLKRARDAAQSIEMTSTGHIGDETRERARDVREYYDLLILEMELKPGQRLMLEEIRLENPKAVLELMEELSDPKSSLESSRRIFNGSIEWKPQSMIYKIPVGESVHFRGITE